MATQLYTKIKLYLEANSKTWEAEEHNIEMRNEGLGGDDYIHAWNVDGYQDDELHMNYGWGGSYNGYTTVDDIVYDMNIGLGALRNIAGNNDANRIKISEIENGIQCIFNSLQRHINVEEVQVQGLAILRNILMKTFVISLRFVMCIFKVILIKKPFIQ